MSAPECSCAMTEGSMRTCAVHGEDEWRPARNDGARGVELTEAEWTERAAKIGLTRAEGLAEWRETLGVQIMHAMGCTHDGDDFGPRAVCETCFANTQSIGRLVERIVAERLRAVEAAVLRAHVAGDYWVDKCKQAEAALAEARQREERVQKAFGRCFDPDMAGVDWRDDAAIQAFAAEFVRTYPRVTLDGGDDA